MDSFPTAGNRNDYELPLFMRRVKPQIQPRTERPINNSQPDNNEEPESILDEVIKRAESLTSKERTTNQ